MPPSERPLLVTSISWPALEGAVAYLFLITVAWSVPDTAPLGVLVWSGFLTTGIGGASVALAYWRERSHEAQQPHLHGIGVGGMVLGILAIALSALA